MSNEIQDEIDSYLAWSFFLTSFVLLIILSEVWMLFLKYSKFFIDNYYHLKGIYKAFTSYPVLKIGICLF